MLDWLSQLDSRAAAFTAAIFVPLAVYITLNGLDDLFLDLVWLCRRRRHLPDPPLRPESRFAILIPLWHEHAVISRMVDHNLAAIRYSNYEVFIGVYRNDDATLRAVRELENRYARVHLALVPHDGPTVKADCLNWIYQRLIVYEEQTGVRFESIAIHDAEDLIHPEALERMNRHLADCDMVQMPVLPLPTPWWEMTHGVYCDDFAEGQSKDLSSRIRVGAFLPGCGVGTGFRREALDQLAENQSNRLFNPSCLTEDYDNGLRMHRLGFRQRFIPLEFQRDVPLATREYFPRRFRIAVRQRTRWITGNALQMWQEHGWLGGERRRHASSLYFLWRDRKGLLGNPLSLLCNLLAIYAALSLARSLVLGGPWWFAASLPGGTVATIIYASNFVFFLERVLVRILVVRRIYGWALALGVPPRMFWANLMNAIASIAAICRFTQSRWKGQPLRWLKTEHAYPTRSALFEHKQRIGEVLVTAGYLDRGVMESTLATLPEGVRFGQHLIDQGLLSEDELYEGLSLQQSLPCVELEAAAIPLETARALPGRIARQWQVMPFSIAGGRLSVASPEIPTDDMQRDLERYTRLEIRFHLIKPSCFEQITASLL